MTFTWVGDLSTDLDKVRFHIGDTDSDGYFLTDETINALLSSESTVGGAVVACLKYIITQLSRPDFKADWLTVNHEKARKGYEMLLGQKRVEFSIPVFASSATYVYRADSDADEEPYANG